MKTLSLLNSAIIILMLSCICAQARPKERIALLIGNKDYSRAIGSLDNPHKDIELLASTLRGLGFRVMPLVKDAGRNAILGAIYDYTQALKNSGSDSVGFFYYSGHGLAVDHANYIVPVDVPDLKVRSIRAGGLPLDRVTSDLKSQAPTTDHFVVFDACRNVRGVRGNKGFVAVRQRNGMLIAFSTAPGKTASDGSPNDPAGPYASILAQELKQPGQHEGDVFYNVRKRVAALGEDQLPRQRNGLLKRHYFAPRMSKNSISMIQTLLLQLQYNPGPLDGTTGEKTRKAIMQFQRDYWDHKPVTGDVSENLLISLQAAVRSQNRFARMNASKPQAPKPRQKPQQPVLDRPVVSSVRQRLSYEPETVRIPGKTFSMSKYEITVGQFKAFVKATGHKMGNCNWPSGKSWRNPGFSQGDKQPVVCVSWNDAVAYAKWLSGKTVQTWRLPKQEEWEYAARAGSKTKYHFGDNVSELGKYAWYSKNSGNKTHPVGQKRPNKFGLYDVHGNVWEWCQNLYSKSGSLRVYRGGSWGNGAGSSAFRLSPTATRQAIRGSYLGFRLLRQP